MALAPERPRRLLLRDRARLLAFRGKRKTSRRFERSVLLAARVAAELSPQAGTLKNLLRLSLTVRPPPGLIMEGPAVLVGPSVLPHPSATGTCRMSAQAAISPIGSPCADLSLKQESPSSGLGCGSSGLEARFVTSPRDGRYFCHLPLKMLGSVLDHVCDLLVEFSYDSEDGGDVAKDQRQRDVFPLPLLAAPLGTHGVVLEGRLWALMQEDRGLELVLKISNNVITGLNLLYGVSAPAGSVRPTAAQQSFQRIQWERTLRMLRRLFCCEFSLKGPEALATLVRDEAKAVAGELKASSFDVLEESALVDPSMAVSRYDRRALSAGALFPCITKDLA